MGVRFLGNSLCPVLFPFFYWWSWNKYKIAADKSENDTQTEVDNNDGDRVVT